MGLPLTNKALRMKLLSRQKGKELLRVDRIVQVNVQHLVHFFFPAPEPIRRNMQFDSFGTEQIGKENIFRHIVQHEYSTKQATAAMTRALARYIFEHFRNRKHCKISTFRSGPSMTPEAHTSWTRSLKDITDMRGENVCRRLRNVHGFVSCVP